MGFKSNAYAELVNKRAVPTQRAQSLTKLNPLGLGVLYNWNWKWSLSMRDNPASTDENDNGNPYLNNVDRDLQRPSQANYGATGQKTKINGVETTRYSGQFLYIGLSIQLPTLSRITEHIKSIDKYSNRTIYRALGTAVYNEFKDFGSNRVINDPLQIPQIFYVCSLFDLGAVEYYMIGKYKTNVSKQHDNFEEMVRENSGAARANNDIFGINSDDGGGGGPLFNSNRKIQEWVMAAYYFIKEKDPQILEARLSKFGIKTEQASGKTLAEKIANLFRAARKKFPSKVTERLIDQSGIDKPEYGPLGQIPDLLNTLSLKDLKGGEGIKLNNKNEIDEGENFLDNPDGRNARDYIMALSLDTGEAQYKMFHSKSGFLSSARDEFIDKILDMKNLRNVKTIQANYKKAMSTLTSQLRAAKADAILAAVQKKNNEIKKALLNDGYVDLATVAAYVQGREALLKKMDAAEDLPEDFKKELKPLIDKAKKSLNDSFDKLEKILAEAFDEARKDNRMMSKTSAIRARGKYTNEKDS